MKSLTRVQSLTWDSWPGEEEAGALPSLDDLAWPASTFQQRLHVRRIQAFHQNHFSDTEVDTYASAGQGGMAFSRQTCRLVKGARSGGSVSGQLQSFLRTARVEQGS